tara:strand:- start:1582 stop:3162 length:1581 start_codon:yes stop_codon:yes gene_type:complete
MDFLSLLVAFIFGLGVKQLGLPPLVGYLAAGFGLHAFGVEPVASMETISDLGITLLLFTIGLKLNVKDLAQREVWGTTSIHMLAWSGFIALLVFAVSLLSSLALFQLDWQTALLIGFALSFSSTVCVVKVLEEKSELKIRHGKLSIGILVIQDIAAVIFLVLATGVTPSLWALALVLLLFIRPLLGRLLKLSGHGELLILVGFFLALGGSQLFYAVDLKGDLGALIFGMLLASHSKANELYKSLMGFKDIFLIGFFLSIGFTALPSWEALAIAAGLSLLLPVKFALFFALLVLFKLRARTAFLASLALMNFSEFGLIVATTSVALGWLSTDWLVAIALAVSLSFIVSSYLYKDAHNIYARHKNRIARLQRRSTNASACPDLPGPDVPNSAEVLIVGMGRVGCGTYTSLHAEHGNGVWGLDADSERIKKLKTRGHQVMLADAEDIEFWEQLDLDKVRLIMLTVPSVNDMKNIIQQLQLCQFRGRIAAIAQFEDHRAQLLDFGADAVFNYYAEVGSGFAAEGRRLLSS